MSTLALSIAAAPLGPVGVAVATAVGGIIDSQFLFPLVFGKPQPAKLDDQQFQTASEGAAINYCLGPENRVSGNILWMDKPDSHRQQTGSKAGGVGQYTYFINLAIEICEGPINSVDKIWADSTLIWQRSTGDPNNVGHIVGTLSVNPVAPQGSKSLSVTLSAGGGDNVGLKGGDHVKIGATTYTVTTDLTMASGASGTLLITPGLDNRIALTATVLYVDWSDAFAEHIQIYVGSSSQTADPLMESVLGVGNVPGYRFKAYASITNLILSQFGNRIPQFTFQVCAQTTKTVASAISDLCLRAGLSSGDIDVTKVTGNITGYTIKGPQAPAKSLEPLMLAYNVDVQEKQGKLVFFTRTNRDTYTATELELGAHESGESAPPSMKIEDGNGFELPKSVTVGFLDKKRNYQAGTAREKRFVATTSGTDSFDLPLVLTHSAARDIAGRLLWDSWRERLIPEFYLPPSYLMVQEGDLLIVPFKTETYSIRIMEASLGANFVVEIHGRIEGYATDDRSSVSGDLPTSDLPVYTPPPITMHVIDIPPLTDSEVRSVGVYVAICSQDRLAEWRGAQILYGKNDTALASKVQISDEATMGFVTAINLDILTTFVSWDNYSTIDVSMWNGTLTPSTDLDVLNGANRFIIQDGTDPYEVIGFVNATLLGVDTNTGGNIYRLSRLLRGLRNTYTAQVYEHGVGSICTFVNSALRFAPLTPADFNTNINFRAVPIGGLLTDYVSQVKTFQAKTLVPWAPVEIKAFPPHNQRVANSSITFSWKRRTRAVDRLFTTASDPALFNPLVEAPEKYLFTILGGSNIASKTYTVEGTNSITISATEFLSVLGLLTQNSISVQVLQVSPLVGKGGVASASV